MWVVKMVIAIKVENLGRVKKNFTGFSRRIPEAGRRALWGFTRRLATQLKKEALAKGHKSSGHLTGKGTFAKKLDKDNWAVMMPYYTKHLEKGTPAGYWIPRRAKLVRWATQHGMSFQQLKFGIHKHGTKPHPFTARVIQNEVKKLKKRVEDKINREIRAVAR